MKLWLIDIIHTIDLMCNTYALMYVLGAISRAGLGRKNKYKTTNQWGYTDTLMVIAFFGVLLIPTTDTLRAIFGV